MNSLVEEGFISSDTRDDLLGSKDENARARDLVKLIRDRVELDSNSYHILLHELKRYGKQYQPVVECLEKECDSAPTGGTPACHPQITPITVPVEPDVAIPALPGKGPPRGGEQPPEGHMENKLHMNLAALWDARKKDIAEKIAEEHGVPLVGVAILEGKAMPQEVPMKKTDELERAATDTLPSVGNTKTKLQLENGFADLCMILDALWDVRMKWYAFGLALGVDEAILEAIKGKDDDTCFCKMISKWLKMAYLQPSWEALVKALCYRFVGHKDLAEEIAEKHNVSLTPLGGKEITTQEEFTRKTDELERAATDTLPTVSNTKTKCKPIAQLSPENRKDLQFQLEQNLDKVKNYFDDYTSALQEIVEEKSVDPKVVSEYLSGLLALVCDPNDPKLALLSPSRRDKLDKATTISKIFAILKTECTSFLNYHIFERLMSKFQIKREQDERLNYPERLTAYVEKHRISEFIELKPILGDLEDKAKLVLVLDIDTMCRLAKILDVEMAVGKILGLKPSALLIHDIKEGCVIVTFLISIPLAECIFTSDDVFTHEQKKKIRKLSVIRLECNGYTYEFGKELVTADVNTAEVSNYSNATITETERVEKAEKKLEANAHEWRQTQSLMSLKPTESSQQSQKSSSATTSLVNSLSYYPLSPNSVTSSSSLKSYPDQQRQSHSNVTLHSSMPPPRYPAVQVARISEEAIYHRTRLQDFLTWQKYSDPPLPSNKIHPSPPKATTSAFTPKGIPTSRHCDCAWCMDNQHKKEVDKYHRDFFTERLKTSMFLRVNPHKCNDTCVMEAREVQFREAIGQRQETVRAIIRQVERAEDRARLAELYRDIECSIRVAIYREIERSVVKVMLSDFTFCPSKPSCSAKTNYPTPRMDIFRRVGSTQIQEPIGALLMEGKFSASDEHGCLLRAIFHQFLAQSCLRQSKEDWQKSQQHHQLLDSDPLLHTYQVDFVIHDTLCVSFIILQ